MHGNNIINAGKKITDATAALVMVHGRGGSAEDILSLAAYLPVQDFALLAPEAEGHTWYPLSFLAPPQQNEPFLSSALSAVQEVVDKITGAGIPAHRIYFLGFSQGACLTLEYVSRNATRYGGVAAFTGGLIGDKIYRENYKGDFAGTPVFIGTSDPDPHVPVQRVYATANILRELNASVTEKVYPNMGHTINGDELELARQIVFGQAVHRKSSFEL